MKSKQYDRAEAMMCADKFNMRKSQFFNDLNRLVGGYMDYDGITVEFTRGASRDLIVTVSVKKVKPVFRA